MNDKIFFAIGYDDKDELRFLPVKTEFVEDLSAPTETENVERLEESQERADDSVDDLIKLQHSYFSQMHSLIDGLPALIHTRPLLQQMAMNVLRDDVKDELSVDTVSDGNWDIFEISKENGARFYKSLGKARRRSEALTDLPEMVLLGMVSQFDAFLGQLLRICITHRPDIISKSQKNFPAHEVLQYSDIEAFKVAVIDKEIESFLRQSHHDQFRWLEQTFGVPLTKKLDSWPAFIEIFERRNLFAHSRGIVSEQYRIKCLEAGCENLAEKGAKLTANTSYVAKSLRIFLEIGIKLTQVLSRVLDGSDQNLRANDVVLNGLCYDLIEHGHYKLAQNLLEFGENCPRQPDDRIAKMMVVNHANAHALSGNTSKARDLLNKYQWEAYSVDFKISVASILGETQRVVELLPIFHPEDYDPKEAFRRWPVFVHVREDENFKKAFEDRFEQKYLEAFDVPKVEQKKDDETGLK